MNVQQTLVIWQDNTFLKKYDIAYEMDTHFLFIIKAIGLTSALL